MKAIINKAKKLINLNHIKKMKTKFNITFRLIILFLMIAPAVFSQSIIGKIGPLSTHKFEIRNKVIPFNVFFNIDQPTGLVSVNNNLSIYKNLLLPNTSITGDIGVLFLGGQRFMHNQGGTFLGINSGHFDGGNNNTGIGTYTLYNNAEGNGNTAVGLSSLYYNYFGNNNTAVGNSSLYNNVDGEYNTALGWLSMVSNVSGSRNTAVGIQSLYSNAGDDFFHNIGNNNTAVGWSSLYNNVSGNYNTALGNNAGSNITTGNNNTTIGNDAQIQNGTLSNQVQIGNLSVTHAYCNVAFQLGSDRRFKSNILNSNLGLNFITKLRPVSYTRKIDELQKIEYGFIAQEVEEALTEAGVDNSGIITISDKGNYAMRYNDLFSPIVKAIQELKAENDELRKEVSQLKTVNEKVVKLEQIVNELSSIKHTSLTGKEVKLANSKSGD